MILHFLSATSRCSCVSFIGSVWDENVHLLQMIFWLFWQTEHDNETASDVATWCLGGGGGRSAVENFSKTLHAFGIYILPNFCDIYAFSSFLGSAFEQIALPKRGRSTYLAEGRTEDQAIRCCMIDINNIFVCSRNFHLFSLLLRVVV